jgi:perosamine synthetase
VDDDDVQAVVDALRSDFLTTGPRVADFERSLATVTESAHAVAMSSGTAALHAACAVAGIQPEDEVIVPAITFAASANCVRYLGAKVVFADVDAHSGLMSAPHAAAVFSERTRAVICVDLNGAPADVRGLRDLIGARPVTLIQDAAHSLGARYLGRAIGQSGADFLTLSFHPVKHITTAEGGAVLTNDDKRAQALREFREHGIVRDASKFQSESAGPWYYEQQSLGVNYRLSDLQCALGSSQLNKLERFVARRRQLASLYDALLSDVKGVRPVAVTGDQNRSAYHLYAVQVDFDGLGRERALVMAGLRQAGIGTQVHYVPVPSHPYYRALGDDAARYAGAALYYSRALSLPMYPELSDADVERVVRALRQVLS